MERRSFETPLGEIWIRGRDTGRPVLLVLHGAFAIVDQLEPLQGYLANVDVWRVHLPGNHCPSLSVASIGAFGFAVSRALAAAAPRRKIFVVGLSAGALVALSLDQAPIHRMMLVEPPLWPTVCWPLRAFQRAMPPGGEAVTWGLFGVSKTALEDRDYRGLVERLQRPTMVMIGAEALEPPRPTRHWPSLVDAASRELLAAHPLVDLQVVPGGHHVVREAKGPFWQALSRGLLEDDEQAPIAAAGRGAPTAARR